MRSQRTDTTSNAARSTVFAARPTKGPRTTELGRPIPQDTYSPVRRALVAFAIGTALTGAALIGALATGVLTITTQEVTVTGHINCEDTTAQIESAIRDLKRKMGDSGYASRAEEAAQAVRDEFRKRCS